MRVYLLRADSNHYESFIMRVGHLFEFARRFDGKPFKRSWKDVEIGLDPGRFPKGDTPSLIPGVPIFSGKAVKALQDVLEQNGELLPVIVGGEEYFLFNVTTVVDALDEPRSEVIRFNGSNKVLTISSYSFFGEKLASRIIFKIPQMLRGDVYVTEPFVKRVRSAGLKGFWFPLVWNSQ
jgi:hypothetical protein